ncbi:MAG: DUF6520 family protein [Lutibacter sp.]
MKKSVLKLVLPAFALLLAVGVAFATTESNSFTTDGYYDHPIAGPTAVPGGVNCQTSGPNACLYNGFQVYAEIELQTELRKN